MWGSHIDDGASPDPPGVASAAPRGRASRLLDLNGDGGADIDFSDVGSDHSFCIGFPLKKYHF